jgi:hypothetical protein
MVNGGNGERGGGEPRDPWDDPDVEIVSPAEVERWRREQQTRQRRETLMAWGHFLALVGALVALFLASWELALFVYPMTVYVVGRALAHVLTDPGKVERLLFFGLTPLAGIAVLVVGFVVWDRWWAAALFGGAAALAGNLVAKGLFRRVAFEERLESIRG